MARCYALLVMFTIFVVFPLQNILFASQEPTISCGGSQVSSDHCYHMELLARASSSSHIHFLVNTSEPATVLTMNQSLTEFRFVDCYVTAGACFGGSLPHWAALRTTGWGTAADACILANSLQACCYIYDANGKLLVSSPCYCSLFSMRFKLSAGHYTTKASHSWKSLTHLPSLLNRSGVDVHSADWSSPFSSFSSSSLWCSGGALRAQTDHTTERQFQ
eukprot:4103392-Amphidinium_carterae.1